MTVLFSGRTKAALVRARLIAERVEAVGIHGTTKFERSYQLSASEKYGFFQGKILKKLII
jgi:hypothetical protein